MEQQPKALGALAIMGFGNKELCADLRRSYDQDKRLESTRKIFLNVNGHQFGVQSIQQVKLAN